MSNSEHDDVYDYTTGELVQEGTPIEIPTESGIESSIRNHVTKSYKDTDISLTNKGHSALTRRTRIMKIICQCGNKNGQNDQKHCRVDGWNAQNDDFVSTRQQGKTTLPRRPPEGVAPKAQGVT